jgi:hypothetical protein
VGLKLNDCSKTERTSHDRQILPFFWHSFDMNISSPAPTNNTEIWASLKQAISASSSFEHWASQLDPLDRSNLNLDDLVQRYLRETLETLAY